MLTASSGPARSAPPRLNPFFFRVRCSRRRRAHRVRHQVLIPSSSGCGAHALPAQPGGPRRVLIPSSSGCGAHVWRLFAAGDGVGLNPFFFRVRCSRTPWAASRSAGVLIPSSSGCGAHSSLDSASGPVPVLIPSSSGCGAHRGQRRAASGVHVLIPSSSGCGAHAAGHRGPANRARLNPFFFRVRCSRGLAQPLRRRGLVLIPSSSGCGAHFASWRCTSS